MNLNDGITYIIITFATAIIGFIVRLFIPDENGNLAKALKKYALFSIAIVLFWVASFYLTTTTEQFSLTKNDSFILLVIFFFTLSVFLAIGAISTNLYGFLIRKNWQKWRGFFMLCISMAILLVLIVVIDLFQKEGNYFTSEAKVTFNSKGNSEEDFEVIVPKGTRFELEEDSQRSNYKSKQKLYEYDLDESIYELQKGDTVILLKDTILNADSKFLEKIYFVKSPSVIFKQTTLSKEKLLKETKVKLISNAKVRLIQRNSFITILIFNMSPLLAIYFLYYLYLTLKDFGVVNAVTSLIQGKA